GAAEILDEIDGRAFDELEADEIHDQLDTVRLGDRVVGLRGLGEFKRVSEAGAAAAVHGKTENRGLVLTRRDRCDTPGGVFGENDLGLAHDSEIGSAEALSKLSA